MNSRNSRVFFILAILVLCASAFPAQPATQPATTPAAGESAPQRLAQVLANAKAIRESDAQGFDLLLQSIPEAFVSVEPDTRFGRANWHRITLNRYGCGMDGIRFRAPADKERKLTWGYALQRSDAPTWYILPTVGTMRGFSEYSTDTPFRYEGFDWPQGALLIWQSLDAEALTPGQEYIIWFLFPHNEPLDIEFAVHFSDETRDVYINDYVGVEMREAAMGRKPYRIGEVPDE